MKIRLQNTPIVCTTALVALMAAPLLQAEDCPLSGKDSAVMGRVLSGLNYSDPALAGKDPGTGFRSRGIEGVATHRAPDAVIAPSADYLADKVPAHFRTGLEVQPVHRRSEALQAASGAFLSGTGSGQNTSYKGQGIAPTPLSTRRDSQLMPSHSAHLSGAGSGTAQSYKGEGVLPVHLSRRVDSVQAPSGMTLSGISSLKPAAGKGISPPWESRLSDGISRSNSLLSGRHAAGLTGSAIAPSHHQAGLAGVAGCRKPAAGK